MKRTTIVLGLAAAVVLGAPAAAQASPTHHKAHGCQSACHHAPRPPGGWPCSVRHDCPKPKPCPRRHHHKPPVKPDPRPPVVVTPKPPIHKPAKPAVPVVHRSVPNTPQASPELPRTGGFYEQGLYGAAGLLLLGGGLLRAGRGSKWTKA